MKKIFNNKYIQLLLLFGIANAIYSQEKPEVLSTDPKDIKKNYIFYMVPIMNAIIDGEQSTFVHGLYFFRNWDNKLSTRINFNQLLLGNGSRYELRDLKPPLYYQFQGLATYSFLSKEKAVTDDVPIKSVLNGYTKTVTWMLYDGIVTKKLGVNLGFAKQHSYTGETGKEGAPVYANNIKFYRNLMSVNTTKAIIGLNYSRQMYVKAKYEGVIRDKNLDWRIYADIMPLINRKKTYGEVIVGIPGYPSDLVNTWTLNDLDIETVKMGYRFGWERIYNGFGQGLAIIFGAEIGRTNIFNVSGISFSAKIGLGF